MDSFIKNEFQDWEVLHSSSDSEFDPQSALDEIESSGLIQADYFSLDRPNRGAVDVGYASAESDNPSWIDPGTEDDPTRFLHKESAEFWSDSSSERSSCDKERKMQVDGFEKYGGKEESLGQICAEIEVGSDKVDDFVENPPVYAVNLSEGADMTAGGDDCEENNTLGEVTGGGDGGAGGVGGGGGGAVEGRRGIVWWKLPMEFLKNFVLKMSPMWTVSFAAAVVGLMILGRRLHKMKKKAKGIQINVAVDDKKASQVMSRAARLNEAFSIVKRVPIVRPAMPAVGTAPWPAMSLR